jgi:hypothetical protein
VNASHTRECPMAEQSVGWVLHALEPDEEIEVLGHLPTCPICRAVVRKTEESLFGLGAAVEQVDPPAGLRDRILDAAAQTPQVTPTPAAAEPPRDTAEDRMPIAPPRRIPSSGPGRDRGGRGGGWLRTPRRKVAAAAVALALVVGIGGLGTYAAQLRSERDQTSVQAQSIVDMVSQFDRPGTRHAFLTPQGQTQPVAAVMVNGAERQVMTVGLAANASDRTYVLWGLADANTPPKAVGTFDVTADVEGPQSVGSGTDGGFALYAISLEPGRTAPASPSAVVASGQVET